MASISAILSSVIGSSSVFGEAWQLHPNQQIRWPPQGHGVLAPDSPTVAPARRSPTISTTSVDTNQQAALKAWVLRGPDPERDGVSAWRLVDICAQAERAYGVRYSSWGMSRLLKRLGLSRQTTRPRHPEGSAAERAAFKKWAWVETRRGRPSASGHSAPALVRG